MNVLGIVLIILAAWTIIGFTFYTCTSGPKAMQETLDEELTPPSTGFIIFLYLVVWIGWPIVLIHGLRDWLTNRTPPHDPE